MKFRLIVCLITAFVFMQDLMAVPVIWTGDGDGESWEDPDNWDVDAVPDGSSEVVINGALVKINSGTDAIAQSVQFEGTFSIADNSSLLIDGSTGNGMQLIGAASQLNVDGVLQIQNSGDIGMLNGVSTIIVGTNGEISIKNAVSSGIGGTTFATLINNGNIAIENTGGVSIGLGIFDNKGTITITNSGIMSVGLSNSGTITMNNTQDGILLTGSVATNSGTVTLNSIQSNNYTDAIRFWSVEPIEFTNSGTISILNPEMNGIHYGSQAHLLTNTMTGTISINGAGGDAILGEVISGSALEIFNEGTIELNNSTDNAVSAVNLTLTNAATGIFFVNGAKKAFMNTSGSQIVSNKGTMTIKNTIEEGMEIDGAMDQFVNSTTGVLAMENCGTSAIIGDVTNQGMLSIFNGCSSTCIVGDVVNSGTLTLMNLSDRGVLGSFENSGTALFDQIASIGIFLSAGKDFMNSGTLTMNNTNLTRIKAINGGHSWVNSGSILMNNSIGNGVELGGIGTLGSQTSTGTMTFSGGGAGLLVSDCSFELDGELNFSNLSFSGLATSSEADFSILETGNLTISNCMRGWNAATGSLNENFGTIHISDMVENGFRIANNASIVNGATGEITIENITLSAISIEDSNMVNLGEITIDTDHVGVSLYGSSGVFDNRVGGVLNLLKFNVGGLLLQLDGTFLNKGTIDIVDSNNSRDIRLLSGSSLVNTGVILAR